MIDAAFGWLMRHSELGASPLTETTPHPLSNVHGTPRACMRDAMASDHALSTATAAVTSTRLHHNCTQAGRWLIAVVRACWMAAGAIDGIVLGASSTEQLKQNLASCSQWRTAEEGLPQAVLDALDAGWEVGKEDCFSYHRGPSGCV